MWKNQKELNFKKLFKNVVRKTYFLELEKLVFGKTNFPDEKIESISSFINFKFLFFEIFF